jgi:hypothetical protein
VPIDKLYNISPSWITTSDVPSGGYWKCPDNTVLLYTESINSITITGHSGQFDNSRVPVCVTTERDRPGL